jgi:hypothetical protein
MPPRPRRLDPAQPIERFVLALRDLHRDAGKPKQQLLAAAMHCSHATVSAILNAHRFPSWEQTEAFVQACNGDVQLWRSKWAEADREITAETSHQQGAEPLLEMPSQSVCCLSGRQLYKALTDQIRRTQYSILATYFRMTPPPYFVGFTDQETGRAVADYFAEVLAWATVHGPCSVRRVICLSNNEMLEWAQQHYADTRALLNYEIRVVDWKINTDTINIAIFDDVAVFLTFGPGTSPGMYGFRIDDRNFVRDAIGYFSRLWSGSTRLANHLVEPPGAYLDPQTIDLPSAAIE